MNEPNQPEANGVGQSAGPPPKSNRSTRYDAAAGSNDRYRQPSAPSGRFPKDDRRSSALLTERERSERWPLG